MRHRRFPRFVRLAPVLAAAVLLTVSAFSSTQAQIGGSIGYGSSVLGNIPAAGQSLTYSFNGSAGDFIQITLRNWTGTLNPRLDLFTPDGQPAAASATHPLSDDPLAAFISLFLPQGGIYSLLISGEGDTTGEFILKLQGRGGMSATPLVYGQSLDVNVPTDPPPQYFTFEAQDCPTVLTLSNLSDGLPFTFPFHVKVHNQAGTQIAQLYGGDALEDRLIVAPSSGRYEVVVSSDDPQVAGMVQLLVTCEEQSPGCLAAVLAAGYAPGICPPCFAEGGRCADFSVEVSLSDLTASFTWSPVEGVDWYIFSILDSVASLLMDSPQLLEGETTHTYSFNPADLPRGPFTAVVSAGAEGGDSEPLCLDDAVVSFEGTTTETCSGIAVGVDAVPGARAAVAHWGAVPGAAAYMIHVYAYADDGGLIGIRVLNVPGDATTYHLADVFPPDYDRFQVRVAAYSEASGGGAFGDMPQGYLCDGSADVTFGPLGPVEWGPAS
ncbi:MAG: hypothetical protein JNL42_13685 [Anaerolineae bacterium]|nr:hypothetical protein [Anaerolineae bacterium]